MLPIMLSKAKSISRAASPAGLRAFAMAMIFGTTSCISSAEASNSSLKKSEIPSRSFLLAARTNDLPLFNPISVADEKQLLVSKGLSVCLAKRSVEIRGPANGKAQSLTVTSGGKPWDLSRYLYLVADIHNAGSQEVTIVSRVEDPEYAGWHHYSESVARVAAGETASVLVFLKRKNAAEESLATLFPGMHALPNGYMPIWSGLDPARITRVVFGIESEEASLSVGLLGLRASGICDTSAIATSDYFPFIDAYGQFRHAEWPSKIHSPRDFETQRIAEAASLRAESRPSCWDKFGGFKDGPQLTATGHFRVEKNDGKWWLVDPEGRLFWSHGVTGVGFSAPTPVRGRAQFFAELPSADGANPKSVNFYLANLALKYGADAESKVAALTHDRLQSWGINTLASWSDTAITSMGKTPYTKTLNIGAPKLAPGLKLPDPFDPAFAQNAALVFSAESKSTGIDPWCIGYFIANELEWRGGPDLVNEVLTAPSKQAGKQALLKMLQQRHASITNLNSAWHTSYSSWNALLESTNKVDASAALADFTVFNEALAELYYQTCQTELKRATPHKLNLGSRFHTVNPIAVRSAAIHCDVVSFNKYTTSIRNLSLPDGLDRPVIVGEFHFPAWDRSFTADGERSRLSQVQRADAYWYYLAGALDNPLVVGTHWFQYLDQPLTGRPDGENWAIGFVDVVDSPYEELTKVSRELGSGLYARRLASKPANGKTSVSTAAVSGKPELVTPFKSQ